MKNITKPKYVKLIKKCESAQQVVLCNSYVTHPTQMFDATADDEMFAV